MRKKRLKNEREASPKYGSRLVVVAKWLASTALLLVGFFYVSNPQIHVGTYGDQWSEPVPIAPGNQLLPFSLTTASRFSVEIKDMRISFDPSEVTLLPNPQYRTEIIPADDAHSVESVVFREPLSIEKTSGILSAIRYVVKQSSNPFRLRFVVRAKIADWNIGLLGHYFPTREWRIVKERTFIPAGMPTISSLREAKAYYLDTQLLGIHCKKFGEAIEIGFSPDVCADVGWFQPKIMTMKNMTGKTLQAGERVVANPKAKTFTLPTGQR